MNIWPHLDVYSMDAKTNMFSEIIISKIVTIPTENYDLYSILQVIPKVKIVDKRLVRTKPQVSNEGRKLGYWEFNIRVQVNAKILYNSSENDTMVRSLQVSTYKAATVVLLDKNYVETMIINHVFVEDVEVRILSERMLQLCSLVFVGVNTFK